MTTENRSAPASALSPRDQEMLNASLLQAARDGDLERVERLIARGAGGPQAPLLLCEPFFDAARDADLPLAKALIPAVNIDAVDLNGSTALMLAAMGGTPEHDELLDLLLENGANPRFLDRTGCDALSFAVRQKRCSVACVRRLAPLSDPAVVDKMGNSALIMAARTRMPSEAKADMLDVLLSMFNPLATNDQGVTALMAAAYAGDAPSARRLMGVSALTAVDQNGRDAVAHALLASHAGLAAELRAEIERRELSSALAVADPSAASVSGAPDGADEAAAGPAKTGKALRV
jgi:ankyrin repeat protein